MQRPDDTSWPALGAVDPRALVPARLALHAAAQPLAAAAYALLPPRADHSHANLFWSAGRAGFVGRPLPSGLRGFLDVRSLRAGLVAARGEERAAFALAGATLEQACARMAGALREAGEELPAAGLALPEYDLPDSPLLAGARFPDPHAAELGELARWFDGAWSALARVSTRRLGGAEVRGWPHHFDLAALCPLDPGDGSGDARSVSAGFSPGDGTCAEPYFYVSPWPYPDPAELAPLGGGARWHTAGFTAAVLPASDLLREAAAGRRARVDEVLDAGVTACLELLATR